MDNLTHTLLGAALAKTPLGRRSPLSPAALVVGANLPDLDVISGLFEKPAYLVYHRGFTHSLLGCALQIVALGLLFRWIERRFFPGRPGSPWLAAAVGIASHPLLDLTNTYGLRPWLPFSEEWIYGDLVFIVDSWMWLIFGGVAFLAGPRSRWGDLAFAAFAIGSSLLICLHPRAPSFAGWVWVPAVAALSAGRWMGLGKAHPERIGFVGLVLFLAYLALLWVFREESRFDGRKALEPVAAGDSVECEMLSPQPMRPWAWTYLAATPSEVLAVLREGTEEEWVHRFPRRLDDPRARRATEDPAGRAWLGFARIPWAWIVESEGRVRVFLLDARYQLQPAPSWAGLEVYAP